MRRKLAYFIAVFLLVALSPLCQADEKRLPFLVLFEPVEARLVRLTILGINEGNGVAIDELEVYAPKKTDNLAAAATGAKTTTSSSLADARHAVKFLNDGRYGNGSCWIAATNGIEWAQVELAQPHLIDTVAFSRDRTGKFADRIPGSFRVEVSLDGKAWQQVAHFPGPGGGVRGKVTADRKQDNLIPAHQTFLPTKPLAAMPRVRHNLVDSTPQALPPGKTISLNGDWWMRQFPHEPRKEPWPPESERMVELAKQCPREGLGEMTSWVKATVPGSVQSALLENGLAPAPWYHGENFRALETATVGKETWFFRRFRLPESWKQQRVRLHFRGVDYHARYYLNGHPLGESKGHFAPVAFDVEKHLITDDENVLAVQLDAFPYQSPLGSGPGRKEAAQCPRAQILANWRGGDFAPTTCPLGITDDVYLNCGETVLIEDSWVRTTLSDDFTTAKVDVDLAVASQTACDVLARVSIHPEADASTKPVIVTKRCRFEPGRNVVSLSALVNEPQLWWPNGYGKQSLYVAEASICTPCDSGKKPDVLHRDSAIFGIRKLEKVFNEGHDMSPYPWTFVVNGKKIYAKGAGWVPMTPIHLMDSARYERILRQAAAAHFTMIRWWGGGEAERPAFYEWCDRLGIMVFQDFFLANNEHDNAPFLEMLNEQAIGFLKLRRNHPCIVQWTGGNELFNGTVNYKAHVKLWKVAEAHDPTRPFTPSSPAIGVKHAITDYFYRPERDFAAVNRFGPDPELRMKVRDGSFPDWSIIGQPHNSVYREWIDRLRQHDFDPNNEAHKRNVFGLQFTAEGGAAVVANAATLKKILTADEWNHFDPSKLSGSWLYHNAKPGGYDWLQHATTEQLFGPIGDPDRYAVFAQFSRGQIIRYGLEEMRRRKFEFSGTLMWQLNETWPNAAGNAVVDYFGLPRVTYDAVRTAYTPVHTSLRFDKVHWQAGTPFLAGLFLTSDKLVDIPKLECTWRIVDDQGIERASETFSVDAPANRSVKIGQINWDIPPKADAFFIVYCTVRDPQSREVLDDHANVFSCHGSTPHFWRPLLEAPKTQIGFNVKPINAREAIVEVENQGGVNAILCRITMDHPENTIFVTSGNHFFLAPRCKKSIKVRLEGDVASGAIDWKTLRVTATNER